jgi:hypothetical protein
MAWIKLDHNVPRHPKIAGLSDRAFRWWIAGLCYASEFLTDGALPPVFIATVPRRAWEELIGADLWYVDEPGRLLIHDYLKHQTSKATIEQERRRNADRRTGGTPDGRTGGRTGGTPGGRTAKKPRPEYRRQKTEGVPPPPPADAGGIRVRREHREQAKAILRSRMGYCEHDPQCMNQVICLDLIAHELAQKAKAS